MKRSPKHVHGHSITRLNHLLQAQADEVRDIFLTGAALGGWSNFNLLARGNEGMLVVKFPSFHITYSDNPYNYQYRILSELAPLNIGPEPIQVGRLADSRNTPFLILKYLQGEVINSFDELSRKKARLLDDTLSLLNDSSLASLKAYRSPDAYLARKIGDAESAKSLLENASPQLEQLIADLSSLEPRIKKTLSSVNWTRVPMHGDLQESNVIFRGERAFLLDFEECCEGDASYDTCYLYLQNPGDSPDNFLEKPKPRRVSMDDILAMVPLVLTVLIAWSIEWLCYSEMDLISPWLTSSKAYTAVMEYTREKVAMLQQYLADS